MSFINPIPDSLSTEEWIGFSDVNYSHGGDDIDYEDDEDEDDEDDELIFPIVLWLGQPSTTLNVSFERLYHSITSVLLWK